MVYTFVITLPRGQGKPHIGVNHSMAEGVGGGGGDDEVVVVVLMAPINRFQGT